MFKKNDKKFCTYFHVNPITEEVFYVGIGTIQRAYQKLKRSNFWNNVVNKHGFEVKIIHTDQTWKEACENEKEYIKQYGRRDNGTGILVNQTNGGDGTVGHIGYWKGKKHSKEHHDKITARGHFSNFWVGKHHSEETKEKIRYKRKHQVNTTKGAKYSDVRKVQMSEITKNTWQNQPHPRGMLGKKLSAENRMKLSLSLKGRPVSQETRIKIGLKHKGKTISEETRRKISQTLMGRRNLTSIKPVAQYDISNNHIKNYDSLMSAENETSIGVSSISNCLKNRSQTAGGYKWNYLTTVFQ